MAIPQQFPHFGGASLSGLLILSAADNLLPSHCRKHEMAVRGPNLAMTSHKIVAGATAIRDLSAGAALS